MGVYVAKFSLGYVPVPKVACTTIKTAMFQLENAFPFNDFTANGRRFYIHDFYASLEFERASRIVQDARFRFAVLRDPVDRFLSAYVNRILMNRDLHARLPAHEAQKRGLSRDPTLEDMVQNLAEYRQCSPSIDYHFAPMTVFLGEDPDFFTRLYRFSELDLLATDLSGLCGMPVVMGHWQKSASELRIRKADVDPAVIRKIADLYAIDRQVFTGYLGED